MILYPIWILFAAVFFAFAYQHYRIAQSLGHAFRLREPSEGEGSSATRYVQDFVHDFNNYVESSNAMARSQHRAAMVAYLVAGLVSLVSMYLTLTG
jgi:hypothetical protein